jgi:hypothetical protein
MNLTIIRYYYFILKIKVFNEHIFKFSNIFSYESIGTI